MKKNAKKNNKGFSLVELIIVVAIMAILIGVLGGQYLKFVERSRKSADQTNVDEIVRAVQIYAADPDADETIGDDSTVVISTSGVTVTDDGLIAALKAAGLADSTGKVNIKLKSKEWKDSTNANQITITFSIENGSVSATVDPVAAAN